ncbi:DNA replication/repair protein RecF [Psychrobacter sp. I-STPA10]|uniref:DNA replication/repair protein RecF n=1 Tax=Psychrobacter sp. I-STPA10 TaxID=2585769 RepID=UPI001E4FDD37|nr:DNA replication and repair protein RecF [Psychrobacter sp. I-STPA10]
MISQLTIHHLRNLQQVKLDLAQCNVLYGANGSGKTSVLEALFLLSRGKSFRHHQPKLYISHQQPHTIIHANFADDSAMAIQKKQDASTNLRLCGQTVYTQSPLTQRLPTLLIDPSSMDILETGSAARRQLIDWMAFHVKQGFHSQWLAYQRLLKQRNTLLKRYSNINALTATIRQELAAWDKGLAAHAALITHYRKQVFNAWLPEFYALIEQLLPQYAHYIHLRFLPGYDIDQPLEQILQQRLAQDCQMGYTRIGCHRADIQILWQQVADNMQVKQSKLQDEKVQTDSFEQPIGLEEAGMGSNQCGASNDSIKHIKEQAVNVLSRGEKKLLITALRLSQLPVLSQSALEQPMLDPSATNQATVNQSLDPLFISNTLQSSISPQDQAGLYKRQLEADIVPIVMLDDITAELDDKAVAVLLSTLSKIPCQLFITSLNIEIAQQISPYWQNYRLFHVKQGKVLAQK